MCSAVVAKKNQLEMVKLLDQYGADIHEVDGDGTCALGFAMDYGRDVVVEYLKSRGCVMPPQEDEEPIIEATLAPSQQIINHFMATVGQPEKLSLIEIVPTGIPISIHAIPASKEHPFVTLFTTGMSEHPMKVPEGGEDYSRAFDKHDIPMIVDMNRKNVAMF